MSSFICHRIDRIEDVDEELITHEKLRPHYGTGVDMREKTKQGKVRGNYRQGIQTDIGDIELSVWRAIAGRLIEKENGGELYSMLLEWETEHNYIASYTKADLIHEALEDYVRAIYDGPKWCDYVAFNEKYRPDVLKKEDMG